MKTLCISIRMWCMFCYDYFYETILLTLVDKPDIMKFGFLCSIWPWSSRSINPRFRFYVLCWRNYITGISTKLQSLHHMYFLLQIQYRPNLEQLECLMITHTCDSHHIPSQNKTKSKLHIEKKNAKNSNFKILQDNLHATHLLKLLYKMYKYGMNPTRTVGATERTWDAGWTDGRRDRRTDEVKPIYPLQIRCAFTEVCS